MKTRESRVSKWKPIYLLRIYQMYRLGMSEGEICKDLGVHRNSLLNWKRDHPELVEALAIAAKELSESEDFPAWVYHRLSPELRFIWDQISEWEEEENGIAKIELMLEDHGKHVRQQLFLHALCVFRFSLSVALSKVNVSKRTFDWWVENDPGFKELVAEIQWHKGNFFEDSLMRLVAEGNPVAVVFANKTYNADRGYGAKATLNVEHSGTVMHGVLDLAVLLPHLTQGARTEVLEAIRRNELDSQPARVLSHREVINNQITAVDLPEVELKRPAVRTAEPT